MQKFPRLVHGVAVAALVIALPTVTAGAAVRGNGHGNGGGNGNGNGHDNSGHGNGNDGQGNNGQGNGNGSAPAATPAPAAPAVPPGQAKKDEAATGTPTAPGQAKKDGTTGTSTAPGQDKQEGAGSTTTPAGTAEPTPIAAPAAPVLGSSMGVEPVTGKVKIRLPDSSGYVSLADAGSIPSGSVVDARRGTLTLRSALDAAGHVQTATVRGAVFEVRQSRTGNGMTDLVLRATPTGCATTGAAARAAAVTGTKKRSKPGARWARDSHGRFRTRGRNSVATVRGTRWSTRETCAGTVTRVMQGAVDVRDVRTGQTVTVRRGHAYLARTRG
jgi:hypothetical protein